MARADLDRAAGAHAARQLLSDARAMEPTDPARARALAGEAVVMARRIRDDSLEAEAVYRLGSIALASGGTSEAFALATDACDLARRAGSGVIEAWALHLVAIVHLRAGDHSTALSQCLAALSVYRSTGHRIAEGQILSTVASIYLTIGNVDLAIETYESALTSNQGLERHEADAMILANIAEARQRRGEYMLAISNGEFALQIARAKVVDLVPQIQSVLGASYACLGYRERAEELFADAIRELSGRGSQTDSVDLSPLASVYLARGAMYQKHGESASAVADLNAALRAATAAGDPVIELDVHSELAAAHKALRDFERALTHQEARFEITQRLFNEGTDLRIQTLRVTHDAEAARQHAEILNLRTNELEAMVRSRTSQLEAFQIEALERLAILGEFRDTDTGEHTVRVGDMSAELAHEMGLDSDWCEQLRFAARLHDIGKVAIPDSILLKPGRLTEEEFEVMKTHTTIGARILSGSTSPLVQLAEEVALNHHERWDGTGYPNARAAEDIPLSGRITTVADVFDALTSERPYKRAWTETEAATYIVQATGKQFDPLIVDAFVRIIVRRFPHISLRSDDEPSVGGLRLVKAS